jgi:hypothetical protein
MITTGCLPVTGSGRLANVARSVGMSWPLISLTSQPKAAKRAPSGSMFMASEVGPEPENPLASMMATRLPSL